MNEIEKLYAACFGTVAGRAVLKHLRDITIERFFGPNATDAELRTACGARALVHQIENMVKRGRGDGQ
jgi:hypothetical protein